MKESLNLEKQNRIPFEKAFSELQEIASILSNMGLDVREYIYDENPITGIKRDWEGNIPFPLVSDGLDGIRASSDKKSGHFRIWFTNGFEYRDNPKRIEITKNLKEAGFDVN